MQDSEKMLNISTSGTNDEMMWVASVYSGQIYIQQSEWNTSGTRYAHPATKIVSGNTVMDHTVWSDFKLKGLCDPFDNYAVLAETANHRDAVHEFLHMPKSGQLRHVIDEDNIMFDDVSKTGKALRYRSIAQYPDTPQTQWTIIQAAP